MRVAAAADTRAVPAWKVTRASLKNTANLLLAEVGQLRECIDSLLTVVPADLGALARRDLRNLQDRCSQRETDVNGVLARLHQTDENGRHFDARIGVLGVEKAGKSSLLSAWISKKMENFLPTAVRRCTGTSVRINQSSAGAGYKAIVHFKTKDKFLDHVNNLLELAFPGRVARPGNFDSIGSFLTDRADDLVSLSLETTAVKDSKEELSAISRGFQFLRQRLLDTSVSITLPIGGPTDDENEFARLIRPYIDVSALLESGERTPFPFAVRMVDIEAHLPGVDDGLQLVDLPGINSPVKALDDITKSEIDRFDLVIVVKGVQQHVDWLPQESAELERLLGLVSAPTRPGQAAEVINYTPQQLASRQKRLMLVVSQFNVGLGMQSRMQSILDGLFPHNPKIPPQQAQFVSSWWECMEEDAARDLANPRIRDEMQLLVPRFRPGGLNASSMSGMKQFIDMIHHWLNHELVALDKQAVLDAITAQQQLLSDFSAVVDVIRRLVPADSVITPELLQMARSTNKEALYLLIMDGVVNVTTLDVTLKHSLSAVLRCPPENLSSGLRSFKAAVTQAFNKPLMLPGNQEQPNGLSTSMLTQWRKIQVQTISAGDEINNGNVPAAMARNEDVFPAGHPMHNRDFRFLHTSVTELHDSLNNSLTMDKAMEHLNTMMAESMYVPFSVEEYEKRIRSDAYKLVIGSSKKLIEALSKAIDEVLDCYQNYVLDATTEALGSLRRIYGQAPELDKWLKNGKEEVKKKLLSNPDIMVDVEGLLFHVTGCPVDDKLHMQELLESAHYPNCVHIAAAYTKDGKSSHVRKLFSLPMEDDDLDFIKHRHFKQRDSLVQFILQSPKAAHLRTGNPPDPLRRLASFVRGRVLLSMAHCCEMLQYEFVHRDCLNKARNDARQMLQSTLLIRDGQIQLGAIASAWKDRIWCEWLNPVHISNLASVWRDMTTSVTSVSARVTTMQAECHQLPATVVAA